MFVLDWILAPGSWLLAPGPRLLVRSSARGVYSSNDKASTKDKTPLTY